jgi:hypothetical protein
MVGFLKSAVLACVICAVYIVCDGPSNPPAPDATGTLAVTFQVHRSEIDTIEPPILCRVVWLEDMKGNYLKTLAVSAWLAKEGRSEAHRANICPSWNTKVPPGITFENDAVSKATNDSAGWSIPHPRVGDPITSDTVMAPIPALGLKQGTYRCCVEVFIAENYNILSKATIELGDVASEATGTQSYVPARHPAGDVLRELKVKFTP